MPNEPTGRPAPPAAPAPAALTHQLVAALAQLADGVLVADAAGRITFVNEAAARLHGVARLDVPPESYAESYHLLTESGEPYPPLDLPLARAVLRGETVEDARWRVRRPDGTEVLAVGSARPVRDANGDSLGAVLTVRDETAAALAAHAVRERDSLAERLRAAFDQSPMSTVVYDAAGRPVAANPAFERLWGVGLADVPPSYSVLTDPQLEAAGVLPLVRRAFAGEVVAMPALCYDVSSTVGRGRTLWTQAHLYPVRDAAGQVDEVVLTHEDVTARREAEAALAQRTAELEEQGLELELSNQQLQDQTIELETQAEELREAAVELEERTEEAEEARRAAEVERARADGILASMAEAHFALDPSFRVVAVNAAMERGSGLSRAAMLGRSFWELFPEARGTAFERHYRAVAAGGAAAHFTHDYSDGRLELVVEVDAYPAVGGGVAVFWRDITARLRAEAALVESEQQFRTIADGLPTLAWTARADGYIDWYNARWYEYTGTTPADMAGWGWQSVHDAAVLPDVLARWTASIASGAPFEMTFPLRGADGRFRPFLTRVMPVRGADGAIARWFGTNTDVSGERAARDAAEQAAARAVRLQALTAALAAATTLDDVAGVVVAETAAETRVRTGMLALRAPGSDEAVIVRQAGLSALVLDSYARFHVTMPGPAAECLRTGAAIFVESREGADGLLARYPGMDAVWESLGAHAVVTVPLVAAGELVGAMSFTFGEPRDFPPVTRDFLLALAGQAAQATERVRLLAAEHAARAEAEEARARADDANRAKSQFLANMSHELRTPLNAIGGYAELLDMGLRGPVTEAQRADLRRVKRAQMHLLGLINDVLNLARIETGRVEYDVQPVALDALIADVAPMIEPQMTAKGLTFVVRPPPPALAVWADADKLRQVLLNVLSNAAKFTDAGGRIVLEVAERADGRGPRDVLFLRVADTGRGIRRDKLDAVFEPFVQLGRHLTSPDAFSQQGTGLGLSISRDLARGMGGDLRARSEEGRGSAFTLTIRRVVA